MINTFNLEQNLLTFPSERDILTGGRGGVSAVEDGWLDGRLSLPRASVHAAAFPPAGARPHGLSATGEIESGRPRGSVGRHDLRHGGLAPVSQTWGAPIPQTTEFWVNAGAEQQGL